MCGIGGWIDRHARTPPAELERIGGAIAASLLHRGPDSGGVWTDETAGVALSFRRLAIQDLTPTGAQPMVSACGRYVIVYNGEVYNAAELRPELEPRGIRFRGHSDTEVILEGCAAWGVETTLRRLIGMFAIALWDRRERVLTLARDRLGIKPLYYLEGVERFIFGSELKALRVCPGWTPELDEDAATAYLRFGYVPSPLSIYRGVAKLPPGHILTLRPNAPASLKPFWDLRPFAVAGARAGNGRFDERAAEEELDELLRDAVRRRLISDVPLGAFLSGGIDSSTVVALMQASSNAAVRTFSIGFREEGYDESAHARGVAAHLGTAHTEFIVEARHALDVVPRLPEWFDEPFADSSQIPTYLVSKLAREHVTVALSGDGGDEVFAGYNRYFWADVLWRRVSAVPLPLRRLASGAMRAVPACAWDRLFRAVPQRWRPPQPGDKVHKLARVVTYDSPDALYRHLVSQWPDPAPLVARGREPQGALDDPAIAEEIPGYVQRMQYLDTVTYLPDDILTKVDRATMAVALEGRVPLLDHRVVEYAWSLPLEAKAHAGVGKRILRRVLARYVPDHLVERPKMGFGVPIGDWLRGPLRDWAETLLAPERLAREGFLEPAPVGQAWREHLSGMRNWQYPLWTVLMFQSWRERWQA
ncbi:MAG: asparagine synthase (glutamine-hydrolyzing) [Alphaproteobacteria bacterium]|nr:asparagine synthase (glutamine-hydrolyzing) [Alphaproteobacteria bacterium]